MENVLKSIIIAILLAVLAFTAGSMVADGFQKALIPAVILVSFFLLLYFGKNCWILVFTLPPVLGVFDTSFLRGLPVGFFVCGVVLLYWLFMYIMGHVRVTWYGVGWFDAISTIFFVYFLYGYVRHPVSLGMFVSVVDTTTESVGGKEYIWAVAALVAYVTVSIIPNRLELLVRVARLAFVISMVALALLTFYGLFRSGGYSSELAQESRYAPFAGIGSKIFQYIVAKYSVFGIVVAPWRLGALLLAGVALLMGGFREALVHAVVYITTASYVHRSLIMLVMMGLAMYASLLYLSSERKLLLLPFGVQRALSLVPGMDVSKDARVDAEYSWQWRVEMWEQAMEPRSGYIKDYVWGDGFTQDVKLLRLNGIAAGRGRSASDEKQQFMETGTWHSGIITAIHRVGYVGLALMLIWSCIASVMMLRAAVAIKSICGAEYVYVLILPLVAELVLYYGSAGVFPKFFSIFYAASVSKVVYRLAAEEGLVAPIFRRSTYVPMMLREGALVNSKG